MNSKSFRMSKCMTTPNMLGSRKKANKSLLCAVMAGVVACGGAASAATLDEVDLTQIPLDKPTLDYLHENNVTMPPELDGEGNVVDGTDNIIFPESGYTLKEVEDKTLLNVITKYSLDSSANNLTEHHYQVGLKNNTYGDVNGDSANYYNWTYNDSTEGYDFVETTQDNAQIIYKYKSPEAKTYTTKYENYTHDYGTVTDLSGTTADTPYLMVGESVYNNLKGETASIDNALFSKNSISGAANVVRDATLKYGKVAGGAIYNEGNLTKIDADFIGNGINASSNYYSYYEGMGVYYYNYFDSYGGAIYNEGTIDYIFGNFIDNYIKADESRAYGAAIYNRGTINNIYGDFISNNIVDLTFRGMKNSDGTTIYNSGNIGNIIGDFYNNGLTSGGISILYNSGTINSINGDFVNNKGSIDNVRNAYIGKISGDFLYNNINSYSAFFSSGLINNAGTIDSIVGNFIGNFNKNDSSKGSIYNSNF